MTRKNKFYLILLSFLFLLWSFLFYYLRNPVFVTSKNPNSSIAVDENVLESHVRRLSEITPNRSYQHEESMFATEAYISKQLSQAGYEVKLQDVPAGSSTFHNIIASYGPENSKDVVVIGAHYDAAGSNNPGADDNASGIAGLIEIAKLLKRHQPQLENRIELVAYTLEEPPYFGGHDMGSALHAQSLKSQGLNVKLMISLEMIGYFSDELFSQKFPLPLLYGIYPWRGNFIAIVGSPEERQLVRAFKKLMQENMDLNVLSINAPAAIPGVDFSDHRSYWEYKWPAIMITDTAFFRNFEYHRPGDTADRLNYKKMSQVIHGTYSALVVYLQSH